MTPPGPQIAERLTGFREGLLSPQELAENLGLSPTTLADWRSQGRGPAYLKAGRKIWYPRTRVDQWLQAQVRETCYVATKSERNLALPVQVGRPGVRRNQRLGRHKTKHERGSANGRRASSGASGGPPVNAKNSGTPIQ